MRKEITYKQQGDGKDSWVIKTFNDKNELIQIPEIVYEDPAKQNKEVELWRIKGILTIMGRIEEVDAALDQIPDSTKKTLAKFVWSNGNVLNSHSDTVKFVQSVLRLTDEEKDSIFEQAVAIKL